MRYEIKGGTLPVVEIFLDNGESINCEGGAMTWMSDNLEMTTEGGGMSKMFSKMLSNEKMFSNTYTAKGGEGFIAFASSFPGAIMAVEVGPGKEIICQKSAYLASTPGVELSIQFQKNVGAGFFGGEGFIMQKISGNGLAFLEIDGSVVEHVLAPGQRIIIDTGYLAMMDGTCTMSIESVKGIKNKLLGGEGFFNTVVTGPGKVALQSMPASAVASVVAPYIGGK